MEAVCSSEMVVTKYKQNKNQLTRVLPTSKVHVVSQSGKRRYLNTLSLQSRGIYIRRAWFALRKVSNF